MTLNHPGQIISNFLKQLNMDVIQCAKILNYDKNKLYNVVHEQDRVDADLSIRFSFLFNDIVELDDQISQSFLLERWHDYKFEQLQNDESFQEELRQVKKRKEKILENK